jgi:CheY-like chemotaxis protein
MGKKILLIDDDKLVLLTVKRLLVREGYVVITAMTGSGAMRRIEEDGIDLIISDIKMPGMDGVETVKKIRKLVAQKQLPAIPEIFITGYATEEIYQEAKTLNAAGYIEKPFDVKSLLQSVKAAI